MTDYTFDQAICDLKNVNSMLETLGFWTLSQMTEDNPISASDRDALIGAIEAMGWAVHRASEAFEEAHQSGRLTGP